MRIPRLRRRAATVTALAALALQLPLAAVVQSQAHPAPAGRADRADVVRQCATPKKGEFACFALRRTDVSARKGVQPLAATPDGYGPGDLRSAYGLPADGGAGQTVAIVDAYDDPAAEADLAVYRQQFGLPECTAAGGCLTKVSQRGGTDDLPAPDPDWAGEISLDIDMVSAVAPNARILLVEADSANFEDLGAAVEEAVALGAKFVSNSYGTGYDTTPGSGEDPSELTAMDPYYNHPGVAVVASTGDDGYGVSYPAVSPYVTAVGGTALTRDTGSARGWSESVWNNAYGGPGSGCSVYEPKPAFQTDGACAKRSVADVSAVADPVTGLSVYQTHGGDGWSVYGGTSASSPIIAGVYAAAGAPVAGTYPNSYPYAQPGALHDVTSGNNGTCTPAALCTAGPGYDGPTGLGTPDGLAALRSGPHGVTSGTVTDRAGGTPLAGATVEAGDHRAVSDASGRYRLDIPPGTYDLTVSAYGYASATDNGVVLADGATVTESFALDAVPRQTVTGKVTDGSGHGWPLYARVSADGVPGGPVFTDPVTGAFTLTLPQNATYTLHIASDYPGYRPVDKTVQVGTAATPDDAALGDGFYWMFSHLTGKHQVSAESAHYAAATATADVPADGTVRRNLSLKAGRLKVTPASIEKTTAWGGSAQQQVTVKNTGTAPATVTLGENPGGAVIQRAGAPLDLVKGHYLPHSLAAHGKAAGPAHPGAVEAAGSAAAGAAQGTAGTAWQAVPDLPAATGDNAVAACQGTVYSAFGFTGTADTSALYAYSADSGAWTELAPAADTRESPAHGIINGRFYAAVGWGASGDPDAKLEIYDIASDTWTTGAADPAPYAGSGSAVLDGRLYAVGGCTATACGATDVSVYDPATDSWSAAAAYPEPVAWQACGAVAGKLYCAGGTTDAGSITHGYAYDPAADSWAPIADQPTDAWGSAYASANGLLLVEGGAVDNGGSLTNQAWAYRPADNTWTALPDANASLYRGGGAAGFYAIGGLAGQTPAKTSEVLPGYDQPDSTDVSWLSESTGTVTLAPGASTAVTVTLDASVPGITQPGTYTASLALSTDTPYRLAPIGVSLTVKPPAGWGKITGTVTASGGAPIAGATVQITTWAAHYTLKTTADGTYALWLDVRNNPLQLIVAKDGYQPTVAKVKIRKGATTTRDFTLLKD